MRCCFLLLLSRLAIGQIVPYGHNPAAGHYATLRGIRLYYETYGAGPPLLLLHGNGGRSQEFSQNIPYFAKRYRVLALDSRAHGQSVDAGNSLSFEMMVRRLCGPAHAPAPRLGLRTRLERRRHHGAGAGPAPPW